jgi:Mn-containing catalase
VADMKLIKELTEMIEEEIDGAEEYVKEAIKLKHEHPSLAKTLYDISNQEMSHIDMLHSEVVKLIEEHRRTHGEPPAPMMAVYQYLHERHIDKVNNIRMLQNEYKK